MAFRKDALRRKTGFRLAPIAGVTAAVVVLILAVRRDSPRDGAEGKRPFVSMGQSPIDTTPAFSSNALFGSLVSSPSTQPRLLSPADDCTQARVAASYGRLPLQFEANSGQTDKSVKFLSRGRGYTMFLTDKAEAVLTLTSTRKSQSTPKT